MQKNLFDKREKIIEAFEKDILLMPENYLNKNQTEKQSEKERKKYLDKAAKEVYKLKAGLEGRKIFSDYFDYAMRSSMLAKLIKSNREDSIELVALIEDKLNEFREDLKNTSDQNWKK